MFCNNNKAIFGTRLQVFINVFVLYFRINPTTIQKSGNQYLCQQFENGIVCRLILHFSNNEYNHTCFQWNLHNHSIKQVCNVFIYAVNYLYFVLSSFMHKK